MRKNLFSVGVCTSKGFDILFKQSRVAIYKNGELVDEGIKQENEIFRMFFSVKSQSEANISAIGLRTWHERLGHINKNALQEMAQKGIVRGFKPSDAEDFFCELCQLGKQHRRPFGRSSWDAPLAPGDLIYSDVCGPMSVESLGGARYFATFKDEVSSFRYVYFLKYKSDLFDRFKEFERLIFNKFGRSLKTLRADNGREYCSCEMKKYVAARGIVIEHTAPYAPEQNGRSERDNRTIVESARTMLHSKKLPLTLWGEAVNAAVYILNRTTGTRMTGTIEMWTGKPEL